MQDNSPDVNSIVLSSSSSLPNNILIEMCAVRYFYGFYYYEIERDKEAAREQFQRSYEIRLSVLGPENYCSRFFGNPIFPRC